MNTWGCNHVSSHSTRAEQDLFMTEQEHACHRILVAALVHDVINTDCQTQNGIFIFIFILFFWSLAGNLGLLIWVIKAEQPQRAALPILSVCAIFSCFGQTMVCLPACGIFNKRTDVDACICTRGLHGRRKRLCMGSWLWEKNTLLHRGLEPASVLCLAFQSDALQTEHGVPPGVLGCSKK